MIAATSMLYEPHSQFLSAARVSCRGNYSDSIQHLPWPYCWWPHVSIKLAIRYSRNTVESHIWKASHLLSTVSCLRRTPPPADINPTHNVKRKERSNLSRALQPNVAWQMRSEMTETSGPKGRIIFHEKPRRVRANGYVHLQLQLSVSVSARNRSVSHSARLRTYMISDF